MHNWIEISFFHSLSFLFPIDSGSSWGLQKFSFRDEIGVQLEWILYRQIGILRLKPHFVCLQNVHHESEIRSDQITASAHRQARDLSLLSSSIFIITTQSSNRVKFQSILKVFLFSLQLLTARVESEIKILFPTISFMRVLLSSRFWRAFGHEIFPWTVNFSSFDVILIIPATKLGFLLWDMFDSGKLLFKMLETSSKRMNEWRSRVSSFDLEEMQNTFNTNLKWTNSYATVSRSKVTKASLWWRLSLWFAQQFSSAQLIYGNRPNKLLTHR